MAVSNRLRFEIFRRDGFRCTYCGVTAQQVALTVDHVTPRALGGNDHPSNLTTACEPCNNGKTSTIISSPVVDATQGPEWQPSPASASVEEDEPDPRHAAIRDIWVNESPVYFTRDSARACEASITRALESDGEDFHRWAEAAQYSAWFGLDDIEDGLAKMDRDQIVQKWALACYVASGEFPSESATERVSKQVDALLTNGNPRSCVEMAAIHAGTTCWPGLQFALDDDAVAATGYGSNAIRMAEAWRTSFHATTGRWPTDGEMEALREAMGHAIDIGPGWWGDLHRAAAAAGAYESTDLRTCFAPRGSVFEAAARLPDPNQAA